MFKEEIIPIYKYNTELYHHGVKGMRWGVRRYQNYDGSYTQKGLKNYRESAEDKATATKVYKEAKKIYKDTKKKGYSEINGERVSITKDDLNNTKKLKKVASAREKADYKQLRRDKAGDKGKRLYQSGKTITGNATRLQYQGYITAGAVAANRYLNSIGKTKEAKYAAYAAAGLSAINGLFGVKNAVEAKNLRAYYGHNRNYRKW